MALAGKAVFVAGTCSHLGGSTRVSMVNRPVDEQQHHHQPQRHQHQQQRHQHQQQQKQHQQHQKQQQQQHQQQQQQQDLAR
ncbi:unnamed protein product [Lampetra planeri]